MEPNVKELCHKDFEMGIEACESRMIETGYRRGQHFRAGGESQLTCSFVFMWLTGKTLEGDHLMRQRNQFPSAHPV